MVDPDLPVLEAVLQSEFDVLAQRLAFLLCQARHNGEQHLTFGIHGIDVLFFKENRDVLLLQFPDIFQAIQRVSGKPADGLGNDHVYVTGDGSGKPLGVLAATGGAETGVTAASATAITADELIDLFYSLTIML